MLNPLHSVDGQMLPKWFIRIWLRAPRTRPVYRNPWFAAKDHQEVLTLVV
jgi:hypothetical protein